MIEIVALNITNLTDARYFAARGASWIFYALRSEEDIPRIKAISAWIDGPRHGLSFKQDTQEQLIRFAIDQLHPEGIIYNDALALPGIRNFYITDALHQVWPDKEKILRVASLDDSCSGLWTYPESLDLSLIEGLTKNNPAGIVLSGSKEDQTGIKNYDLYDEILDMLDSINYP